MIYAARIVNKGEDRKGNTADKTKAQKGKFLMAFLLNNRDLEDSSLSSPLVCS